MTHPQLMNILDKAELSHSYNASKSTISQYYQIEGQPYRISDHIKPYESAYKEGVNDFGNYNELHDALKRRKDIDISDKTIIKAAFLKEQEANITKTESGYYKNSYGTFGTKEAALDNLWRRKLTNDKADLRKNAVGIGEYYEDANHEYVLRDK